MLCHSNMKGEEHSCWPLRRSLGTRAEKAAEESKNMPAELLMGRGFFLSRSLFLLPSVSK